MGAVTLVSVARRQIDGSYVDAEYSCRPVTAEDVAERGLVDGEDIKVRAVVRLAVGRLAVGAGLVGVCGWGV